MAESSLFWDFIVHPEKYEGKTESAAFYDKMAKSITASVSPVVAKVLRDMPTDPSRKGSLIRGLTKNEIDRTAGVIRRGLEQGHHPREIARQLTLVKDLTPSMAKTLLRYEEELKERKLSQKVIDKRMDTARKRMLSFRRQTIAMTEASYAQGIAREREARVKGYTHKMWITRGSYNVCPQCAANEGAGVLPIDTEFPSGVVRPPSHPRCRCVCTYTNEAGIPKATEFHKEITEATNKHREGTKAEVKAALEEWTPKTVKPVGLADVKPQPNYLETILRQKAAQLQKARKGMSAEAKAKAAATRARKKAEREEALRAQREAEEQARREAEERARREAEAEALREIQPYLPDELIGGRPKAEAIKRRFSPVNNAYSEKRAREESLQILINDTIGEGIAFDEALVESLQRELAVIQGQIEELRNIRDNIIKTSIRKGTAAGPRFQHDFVLTNERSVTAITKNRIKEFQDWLSELIDDGSRAKMNVKARTHVIGNLKRARYNRNIRAMEVGDRLNAVDVRTFVHEMGHHLEETVRGLRTHAFNFRRQKTLNDRVERLKDLFPRQGYRANEITKKDRFPHPYYGKLYGDINAPTEMVSKGLDDLYDDPVRLFNEYPETWDFIMELLEIIDAN